ncbi:MAG: hypothetical protein IKZ88_05510 [Neisseriaceae bacterium]|nr:hypothetical protein [Neisseriaceae bacterium]
MKKKKVFRQPENLTRHCEPCRKHGVVIATSAMHTRCDTVVSDKRFRLSVVF